MRYFEFYSPYNIRRIYCDNCQKSPNAVARHNHKIFEINTVVSGTLCFKVDSKEYLVSAGDTIIINPFSLHSAYWTNCNEGEFISFTVNLNSFLDIKNSVPLGENFDPAPLGEPLFYAYSQNRDLYDSLLQLEEISLNKDPQTKLLAFSEIFKILYILFNNHFKQVDNNKGQNHNSAFLHKATNYIHQNYAKEISTNDIAGTLFMSPSVFCHTFKRHFGTNFTDYLCEYRINLAIELYRENPTSLTDIAYRVGFSSYSYFSKMFKKYIGLSPAIYFGKRKSQHT